MSISSMLFAPLGLLWLLLFERAHAVSQLVEMADVNRIARPRAAVVEREEARVAAGLQDGARDHGAGGDVHVIDDLEVSQDHRRSAEGAMPADVGAAGDSHAARS